jgi:hypothetical protein
MSFYQDDDNKHQDEDKVVESPDKGLDRLWRLWPWWTPASWYPWSTSIDNEEDNYHLEEEHEQFIGGAANTDNHHSECLYHLHPI